jgi:predicted enzyme related to lactoylglutathione lyase
MSTADVRGRFIWHELLTTDTAGAAAFYPRVVPWRTQPSSMPGYTLWMAGQTQIGGLTALPQDVGGPPPHWLIYVGTPSVDASCLQAQGLGAKVVKPPADIPNVGRFAVLSDPQGATFALFTPGAGPPPGPEPPQGGFSWHELATTDVQAAARFYGELFSWRKGRAHDMGPQGVYQIFEHAGNQAGGMCNVQGPSTPPSWLSYVHVADSNRAVAAAKAAGGRLVHGPMEVPGGSWIALMMDPQGGAFAVQEAPRTVSQPRPAAAASATPKLATAPKPAAPPPAAAPMKAAPAAPMKAATAAPMKAAPAAPKPAAVRKPAKKKAAKKKAAKKVKKKAAPRGAKRKTAGRKVARKPARRSTRRTAPKKRARGRRR